MNIGHVMATVGLLAGASAWAQPADLPIPAATTSEYPPGVKIGSAGGIPVYTDAQGRTLYGMDMRTLLRHGPDPSQYCMGACAQEWEPVLAPADAKPNITYPVGGNRQAAARPGSQGASASQYVQNQRAPDWTIIQGPQGPQWVYKGWHMVYVRKGDTPGSAAYEGADNRTWNTLKFVPPVPKAAGPVDVAAAFVDGGYALVDKHGNLLFTGDCGSQCAGWQPFTGALASRGVAEWSVQRDADAPQWLYRGKPVFVAQGSSPAEIPAGAAVLRP